MQKHIKFNPINSCLTLFPYLGMAISRSVKCTVLLWFPYCPLPQGRRLDKNIQPFVVVFRAASYCFILKHCFHKCSIQHYWVHHHAISFIFTARKKTLTMHGGKCAQRNIIYMALGHKTFTNAQ